MDGLGATNLLVADTEADQTGAERRKMDLSREEMEIEPGLQEAHDGNDQSRHVPVLVPESPPKERQPGVPVYWPFVVRAASATVERSREARHKREKTSGARPRDSEGHALFSPYSPPRHRHTRSAASVPRRDLLHSRLAACGHAGLENALLRNLVQGDLIRREDLSGP